MSAQQWYMAIGGNQLGPVSEQEVISSIENGTADGNTLVFTAGMTNWTPIAAVPSLAAYLKGGAAQPPPPMPGKVRRRTRSTSGSTARTCSLSKSSSTRARARWPKPAR